MTPAIPADDPFSVQPYHFSLQIPGTLSLTGTTSPYVALECDANIGQGSGSLHQVDVQLCLLLVPWYSVPTAGTCLTGPPGMKRPS